MERKMNYKRRMNTMHEEITFLGRVMEKDETVWFDWTCSGFQFAFEAERVEVELTAVFGEENGQRLTPFLAVFLDDMEMPYQVIELTKKTGSYVLYEGDASPHRMRVLKRTEAQHTRTGLMQIRTTGGRGLSQWPLQETFKIEFIGDSITCGFGNETNRPEDGFIPCQENGWERTTFLILAMILNTAYRYFNKSTGLFLRQCGQTMVSIPVFCAASEHWERS